MPDPAWPPRGPGQSRGGRLGLIVGLLFAPLAACGAPPATYDLAAPALPALDRSVGRAQLAVDEPTATLPVDSNRIVVRTGPDAIAYLKGAQWADTLPRLVQARLIDALERSPKIRGVGRPGLVADYTVHAEIRRFEADVTAHEARVEIAVRLIRANGRIAASDSFGATAGFATDSGPEIGAALDEALGKTLEATVGWTAAKV
jgi:cholesterol transport system auxiliary component